MSDNSRLGSMNIIPSKGYLKNLLDQRKEIINKVHTKTLNSARTIRVPGYLSHQIQTTYSNASISKWCLVLMGYPINNQFEN